MKNPLLCALLLAVMTTVSQAQILRPFTQRYYNSSARGAITYVSNSIISTTGIGSGSPGTGEIPPAGSSKNGGVGINIDVDNLVTNIFDFGSTWKYRDNDTRYTNWQTVAYDDAVWTSNIGKFGYNASQATCITSGCTPICSPITNCTKYFTTYFRKVVNFNPGLYYNIRLNLMRNDGVVIYVNGTEVNRNNMPTGTIAHATPASSNITIGAAENLTVDLSPSLFVNGNNTIAVEIHLNIAKSADMSFDMELQGFSDNGTYNSSTSDLNIPNCSNVVFAGLYWGAGQGASGNNSGWITNHTTCKFKIPGASTYTTITSTQTDIWNNTLISGYAHTGFQCFKDVTSIINTSSPNGTYTLGNVVSPAGIGDAYGGWTLVIVYLNATLPLYNLTVFDGCAAVKSGSPSVDINISGFLTPPTGPVSCELGAVVFDGDRSSSDSFAFKQNGAAGFYNLATTAVPFNGNNDAWNSKITKKGGLVTTRNPAFNNTLGYDASIFDLPNAGNAQLGNNKTSATVRFASPSENYIVQLLTTEISQFNPAFSFEKTATDLNGGSTVTGDSLRYRLTYTNVGNDSSTNSVIVDNIPAGTSYKPGTLKVNGVSCTDAAGDDLAEYDYINKRVVFRVGTGANATNGGNLGSTQTGNVQFDVVISSSCKIVACVGAISNTAQISYRGKTSSASFADSSSFSVSGCLVKGPFLTPLSGQCFTPKDTLLVVRCPVTSVMLPTGKYAGYTFYSAKPFIPANMYNATLPVTSSNVFWAFYSGTGACNDTARVQVIITACPDIDDDDDGIPDYVEFDNPLALQDHNSNGIPNWNDPAYPGYVDNNSDGYNDNFDWGADSDNDGIPNFQDRDFWITWIDINNDGVNDKSDKDLDGIPNQYDLDSDNDGIPDTVESYGVDVNGDGKIDNYSDTDFDGLSQNVDASNTGVAGSGSALGAIDFDGDGIPNYLDLDSDNDGIPDIIEAGGTDINNDGKVDNFTDANGDGMHDNYYMGTALLQTGPDVSPVDGRADSFPNKNKDRDAKPNPYDIDSDGDGIVDVIEAGFPDANLDGIVDGVVASNGWSNTMSSRPTLGLRNSDADPYPDYLDIDSDNDGIPDNIEAQATAAYKLPGTVDTDGDGLVDTYDNKVGFAGSGLYVYDHDADGLPDYRDLDSDGDGQLDIVEGNDFNLNGYYDDNVTLTGLDTDGDGLDNRFDSLNSVTNIKGTSYRMGNLGSFIGDASPGSRCTVQKKIPSQIDRDWRYVGVVLPVQFLRFTGTQNDNTVLLNWTIIADKEVDRFEIERSTNNSNFIRTATVKKAVFLQLKQDFSTTDDITNLDTDIIYYRLKVIGKESEDKYSNVLVVRKKSSQTDITISPNPTNNAIAVKFSIEKNTEVSIYIRDNTGKILLESKHRVIKGSNIIHIEQLNKYSNGIYQLQLHNNGVTTSKSFIIRK